jgi:outer membrane immunogenic protein
MKNLVLGSVALIAIGVSIPAPAADMAVKAPPPSAPAAPYNWSGLYVGGSRQERSIPIGEVAADRAALNLV